MPLEMRKTSDWWYGRYVVDGRRYCVNLGEKIRGTRPLSPEDSGDEDFRLSRARAATKLEATVDDALSKRGAIRTMERIYEAKTGESSKGLALPDLADHWAKMPRRRPACPQYLANCRATLGRFTAHLNEHHPTVKDMSRVTTAMAKGFLAAEEARGVTAKTWNDALMLLRSTYRRLAPPGAINPFAGIPTRATEPIFRQPFSPEEMRAILEAAVRDPELRPVIVTGMCTAMRRGDCCLLRWRDVDLKNRYLNVKTAKTGQTVAIPIFPMLLAELEARRGQGGDYVFPEIAAKYRKTPLNITRRIRRVLAAAGFKDVDPDRKPGTRGPKPQDPGVVRGAVTVAREDGKGLNRVSIRDFHSFRVTWVTIALSAGVPLELVQKVTGHKTTDIVLKHYFQPGRETFRDTLQKAMPKLLSEGTTKTLREEMESAIHGLERRISRKDRQTLLALAARIGT